MYTEICNYASSRIKKTRENCRTTKIAAYVVLDKDGNYEQLEVIDKKDRAEALVPSFGTYSRTEKQADPIVEKCRNVFYAADGDGNINKKHESYITVMENGSDSCTAMTAVWNFLHMYENDSDFTEKILNAVKEHGLKDDDQISYKINGNRIEDMYAEWEHWIIDCMKKFSVKKIAADEIVSAISGTISKSVPAQGGPVIQNVPNDIKAAFGLSRPIYVASAKYRSYESYGFEKALGFQISEEDAKTFAASVEFLLNDKNHNNKNFQVLYFYNQDVENLIKESFDIEDLDEEEIEEILNEDFADHEPVMSKILSAVQTGDLRGDNYVRSLTNSDAEYYMVQFKVPTGGRFCLCNEIRGKYSDLISNLYTWYRDTSLFDPWTMKPTSIFKLYSIFLQLVSKPDLPLNKVYEAVENEFGSHKMDLLRSVYYGQQIPYLFYQKAIDRAILSVVSNGKITKRRRTLIQIIKCYLIRKGLNIMPELSEVNTAYACGQLFAVYERMQYLYAGSRNKDLAQSYFSAAMKQPSAIFAQIADLGTVYLNKIKDKDCYIKKLGELSQIIGTEFPKTFDDDDKGSFILGYYQQKAEFLKQSRGNEIDSEKLKRRMYNERT